MINARRKQFGLVGTEGLPDVKCLVSMWRGSERGPLDQSE